ncbi:MAG TPA: alpha/beta hydrolase [Clostridiales bacterium]|nr:alpha/beta hydrolase [Clostridiales bacterium]
MQNKFIKITILVIVIIATIFTLIVFFAPFSLVINKDDINVYIKPVNEQIKIITADSSNRFLFMAQVRNNAGEPISGIPIVFNVDNNVGILSSKTIRTNKFGEAFVTYIPPDNPLKNIPGDNPDNTNNTDKTKVNVNNIEPIVNVTVSAEVSKWNKAISRSKFSFSIITVPVVLVHGYQSSGDIFSNMKDYLNSQGFNTVIHNYDSTKGVSAGAKSLKEFLKEQKTLYLSKGIQLERFDIVSHSMGGIISRYYSVSSDYIEYNNIRKLIFISVPHKGSHLAPIGAKYFNDAGVKDMMPESSLFTELFPSMINKGLNPYIQTGNIIGQYDEVVSIESAGLQEWRIETRVFNIGSSKFNVDNFIDGTISHEAIHKLILNNKKVYETIVDMLVRSLPYPSKIN